MSVFSMRMHALLKQIETSETLGTLPTMTASALVGF